jgi:hypothetical protein
MIKDGEYAHEYCKYVFSEDEKKVIATTMALNVTDLASAEDEKKAIMSDFKSRIDGLQANVNGAATKLNNGYEMRSIKCKIVGDFPSKLWSYIREDNGETAKEIKMSSDDLQRKIDD